MPQPSSAFSVRSANVGAGMYPATSANGVDNGHCKSPNKRL
eukprot:CAMPEP_0206126758 /NCGR_PEP_ID=MMETSP1472-20131121/23765_1 /ASSEMBLY_ACC=CAM_ASM_001108 /TAXON_ID=41880 /ORGANISM="Pycnococcus provasolii, Strain RCC251" /LENGTH=40 /DNA_ID= /DNA_START= /DNA_END= /DNA_ORIENTATION=